MYVGVFLHLSMSVCVSGPCLVPKEGSLWAGVTDGYELPVGEEINPGLSAREVNAPLLSPSAAPPDRALVMTYP